MMTAETLTIANWICTAGMVTPRMWRWMKRCACQCILSSQSQPSAGGERAWTSLVWPRKKLRQQQHLMMSHWRSRTLRLMESIARVDLHSKMEHILMELKLSALMLLKLCRTEKFSQVPKITSAIQLIMKNHARFTTQRTNFLQCHVSVLLTARMAIALQS